MRRITVDPITRLEGHGRIEIFLNENGEVADAFLQIPELRGFEKFCQGRPVWELASIVPRICGVCPGAHHMAAGKAIDAVYAVDPPPAARKLRELFYCAHFLHSHIAHFYLLAAPDFVVGPDADRSQRNVLGMVQKVGAELVRAVIEQRKIAQEIQSMLAGRATHPSWNVPGGVSRGIDEATRKEIGNRARGLLEFATKTLGVFDDVVLRRQEYLDLILSEPYQLATHFMGMVDQDNRVQLYDGVVRVVDTVGQEVVRYRPLEYSSHISEHVEPWTYLKFPHLSAKGWSGLVDGRESGVFQVAPLARLNVAEGFTTPRAEAEYERFFEALGGRPVHATLASHWARVVELVYAAERLLELAEDPEVASPDVRTLPEAVPSEGVGIVEAPRGTLIHHYSTDERGIVTDVNLIVGTTNNYAAICLAIKAAARGMITKDGDVTDGALNRIEMAFRAFDPCFSCATHSLPGQMPLDVVVCAHDRSVLNRRTRR
jgi:F420-non-reducing hydrogenase large subunit